ncbi:MAG: thymidine phosphorylase [Legionellales bacterium]|nr:thymidine phosphorylase [Legionellales bacterium]
MTNSHYTASEIIQKKRDGQVLSADEIQYFVAGLTSGTISDAQIAAFAMAVFFRDLNLAERVAFTQQFTQSGEVLNWSHLNLPGPIVDKHSTGGIGDKVSLILVPLMAACGAFMPKMSGRALGHTGGTLDKMLSIPNYNPYPNKALLEKVIQQAGCAIIGQSQTFTPADKKLYSLRHQTSTIDIQALIVISIIAKKLALGCDFLVLETTYGSGALVQDKAESLQLAQALLAVTQQLNLPTSALLTNMDQCLGNNMGNSLELIETFDFLTGKTRDPRLLASVTELACELLILSGLQSSHASALTQVLQQLNNGTATEHFAKMIHLLGGPHDLLEKPRHYLPEAPLIKPVYPISSGFIHNIDARAYGIILAHLGGMANSTSDAIDYAVGLSDVKGLGEFVDSHVPLALIHARNEQDLVLAQSLLQNAIALSATKPEITPVISEKITLTHSCNLD